jgi:hypothetical protein
MFEPRRLANLHGPVTRIIVTEERPPRWQFRLFGRVLLCSGLSVSQRRPYECTHKLCLSPRQETYLAQTRFRKRETTNNHPHQNVLVTRTKVKTLYKQQTSHILNNAQTSLDLRNTTLGYGFHFQHGNSRTIPIESLAHDSGRTLVCAKYGYPKGSSDTNS